MPLFKPVVDVKHRPFCGPTAVAALTGVPLARIEKMLRRSRKGYRDSYGRKIAIKGTHTSEVLDVLRRLDCKVGEPSRPAMTFARFCDDTINVPDAYLVEVPGHFMVTCQGLYCDNGTLAGPQPASGYRKPLRRIKRAWKVEAPTIPKYTLADPISAPPREPKPKRDIKEVRAEQLAARILAWERRKRRAETALKKLRPKLARYRRLGIVQE